jgi:hypothetical protein
LGEKTQGRVAELLPTREGHFVFESGHHGESPLCSKGVPLTEERPDV